MSNSSLKAALGQSKNKSKTSSATVPSGLFVPLLPQCLFPFVSMFLSSCEVVLRALLHTSSCCISSWHTCTSSSNQPPAVYKEQLIQPLVARSLQQSQWCHILAPPEGLVVFVVHFLAFDSPLLAHCPVMALSIILCSS